MANARLEMIFRTEEGSRFTISVQEPKPDLTSQEVQQAMELIVDRNVFSANGSDLVGVVGARLVTRDVVEVL